jgi:lipoprotein signal peptidase
MLKSQYIPLISVPFLDQFLKLNASSTVPNPGVAFSFLIDQPIFVKTVLLGSGFLLLLTLYVYSMYLLVHPVLVLRVASSFFIAGALSNCLDRIWYHYVRDHFTIDGLFYFNFADLIMWLSLPVVVFCLFYYRNQIWRENCLRKSFAFLGSSHVQITKHFLSIICVSYISLMLFHLSFVRYMNVGASALRTYLWLAACFSVATAALTTMLVIIYSQRIVGPLQALKRHLVSDDSGNDFTMRKGDPLVELKEISSIIKGLEKNL